MAACAKCCTSCRAAVWRRLRENLLLVLIFVGVVVGFVAGFASNKPVNQIMDPERKATVIMLIGFPGEIFMSALKMLILPLIVASLITALATLDAKATGKIGRRTVIYYIGTMLLAVLLGVLLVTTIRPGVGAEKPDLDRKDLTVSRSLDSFLDLLRYETCSSCCFSWQHCCCCCCKRTDKAEAGNSTAAHKGIAKVFILVQKYPLRHKSIYSSTTIYFPVQKYFAVQKYFPVYKNIS